LAAEEERAGGSVTSGVVKGFVRREPGGGSPSGEHLERAAEEAGQGEAAPANGLWLIVGGGAAARRGGL